MIGDQEDVRRRLRLTLPARWFADQAPVLDGLLAGLSTIWASLYALLQFVRRQARIGTATGEFLDLAARDFLSAGLSRRASEIDDAFRARLTREMQRGRVTRAALAAIAQQAGFSLNVFEAAQPADTGVYTTPSALAWNVTGGWGSLQMPLECLLTASPGGTAFPQELIDGVAASMPAGGAGWLHITST